MGTKLLPFDVAELLDSPEAQREFLRDAFATGDAKDIQESIGIVARARGMTQTAREVGVGRESLYKTLSPEGNPEFSTIVRVVQALGLKLTVEAAA